jgi:hypothetical protein
MVDIYAQENQLDPLRIIEKAINFLRRRFDQLKHKKSFDKLSETVKILKTDENDYGFQMYDDKFVIWEKRETRNGKCMRNIGTVVIW